jgi:hypothetical protein
MRWDCGEDGYERNAVVCGVMVRSSKKKARKV